MKGMIRPKAAVLPDSAKIPRKNLVEPPPDRFSHEVTTAQPYYYDSRRTAAAAGTFEAGTQVLLLSIGASHCRVIDARGLSVFTACAGLAALSSARSRQKKVRIPRR